MSDRAAFFARIREALRVEAPPRHLHGHGLVKEGVAEGAGVRQWLPKVGGSWAERFALFQANAAALQAAVVPYRGDADLQAKLREQAEREGWRKIGVHAGRWSRAAVDALPAPQVRCEGGYAVRDLETCDVGVTECDALVAQTGSVLVTTLSAGGRTLSVLPPHHVVLARHDQLVPDLTAAYAVVRALYGEAWPSFLSFITGPSRTGDIERILVLGAHGPKRLTIYCGLPPE